jgi:hypothetical protein
MLLFILLASLACPAAAYADDGTPPPPATEEPIQPPEEATQEPAAIEASDTTGNPAPDEVAITEVPIEEPAATAEISVEEIPNEPAVTEDVTVADVLETAPEGTEVVVLDESGNALPLASTEAAEITATVDPVWCPAGQNPGNDLDDGVQNCTTNFGTPQELIDDMGTDVDGIYDHDGVIYFTASPGGQFLLVPGSGTLDVAEYTAISDNNLTLQGGWNGATGTGYRLSGQTDFGANPVQIGTEANPWGGNITINSLTIQGAGTTGLTVFTEGDINLSNVASNDNAGDGVHLDNSFGSGNIRVGSVSANDNDVDGIEAYSNGDIALESVTTNGNTEEGAYLANFFGQRNITISSSTFSDNGSGGQSMGGLFIFTSGNATLTNVNANGNTTGGASLINVFGGQILIVDSHFDGNAKDEGFGLAILSMGSVTLDGVSASHNQNAVGNGTGAVIGAFDVVIQDSLFEENGYDGLSVGGETVTIVCSQFTNNGGVGVEGTSVQTALTFNDVTFSGNGDGEYIYGGTPVMQSGGCAIVKNSKQVKFHSSLPLHIVPVSGGEQVELDCGSYSGTKLILPNGDQVTLPCPIRDHGVLAAKTTNQLPAPLNAGFGFASALEIEVIRGGEKVSEVKAGMTIDFAIPDGQQGASLAILHWDAEQSKWVEVPGVKTGDGRFMTTSNVTGIYVLATK